MDKRNFVYASLSLLTSLSSIALFYFWQGVLSEPFGIIFWEDKSVLVSALWFVASTALFLSFDSLLNLLVKDQSIRMAVHLLTGVIFGVFTWLGPISVSTQNTPAKALLVAFATMLFSFLALLYFSYTSQKAISEHLHFNPGHVLGPRLGTFMTIFGLILAGQYFLVARQDLAQFRFQIPDAVFNQAFQLAEEALGGQLVPGSLLGRQEKPVESGSSANTQQLPPELVRLVPLIKEDRLPPTIKEEIKRQLPPDLNYEQFKQMVQNIPVNKQGQIETHPDSAIFRTDFIAPVKSQVQEKVNELIEPYRSYLPFVLAVLFFLILKSFGFMIDWLALILLAVFIGVLKLGGLVEEKTVSVEAKRLQLKE